MTMTSLAKQLERLAVPVVQPLGGVDTRRVSFLFNPTEAANLDREAVYLLGVSGLEVLETLDASFAEYKSSLFSASSQTWERSVQTAEANRKLDAQIHDFLLRVSPYLLMKAAHKTLEWLVYRFHVHLFNVDDIILSALPYHETKVFVRLLQLLKLENPTNKWHWLNNSAKTGTPLALDTICNQCRKNPGFLSLICDLVPSFIKVHGPTSRHLGAVVALATSCLLATLQNKEDITERVMSILVPHLTRGFKTKCLDFTAGCYMVLSMLCSQVPVKESVLNSLLPVLTKKIRPGLQEEALQCLCVVFQTQQIKELPKKSFKHLCRLPGLAPLITGLSQQHQIVAFLRPFLSRLVPLACDSNAMEAFSNTEGSEDFGDGPPQYSGLLLSIIQEAQLQGDLPLHLCRLLLRELLEQKKQLAPKSSENDTWATMTQQLLSALERRYTDVFDSAVDLAFEELESDDSVAIGYLSEMTSFTSLPVKYARVGNEGMNLSLGLNHANKTVRTMASQKLVSSLADDKQTAEDASVEEMLLARLNDSEMKVVQEILKLNQRLSKFISRDKLLPTLLSVIDRMCGNEKNIEVLSTPVSILVNYLKDNPNDLDLLLRLLSLLLITDKNLVVAMAFVAEMILQEAAKKKIPMLQSLAKEWLKVQHTATDPDLELMKDLNRILFKSLGKTLAKADNTPEILEKMSNLCNGGDQKFVCLCVGILTEMLHVSGVTEGHRYLICKCLMQVILKVTQGQKVKVKCDLTELSCPFSHQAELLFHKKGEMQISRYFLCWAVVQLTASVAKLQAKDPWPTLKHIHTRLQVEWLDFLTQRYYASHSPESFWSRILAHYIKVDLGQDKFLSLTPCLWTDQSISPVLYVGSFPVMAAILSQCRDAIALLKQNKSVFPALLCNLSSECSNIRTAALDCLRIIREQNKSFTHSKLIKRLGKREEELLADPDYLKQAIGKFFSSSEEGTARERNASLGDLQSYLKDENVPLKLKERLLKVTSCIPCQLMLDTLVVVGESILQKLQSEEECDTKLSVLALVLSRFDEESAGSLEMKSPALDFFISSLKKVEKQWGDRSPSYLAVKQLTKEFFHALPSLAVQQKVLSVVLDTTLSTNQDVAFVTMATAALRHMKLEADHISGEFSLQEEDNSGLRTLKGHKRTRTSSFCKPLDYPRVTLVLEVIQARKKIKDADLLVTLMFRLLNRFILHPEEGSEYCKQLVLTILHTQCTKWTDETKPKNQELVNAEVLVQCLRGSHDNLHTQQQTLHLLSALATLYPDYILHNVMSVFTFLGSAESGLLQQEDKHSYQTITLTMETLIPALIKAHSGDHEMLQQHVTQILQVFVDARYHIPKHRCLPLLSGLLREVGVEDFLWVMLVLIVESSVRGKDVPGMEESGDITEKDKSPLDRDVEFACGMCDDITASIQVTTATKILAFLQKMTTLNQDGKGEARLPPRLRRKHDRKLWFPINTDSLTPQQLRLVQYTVTKLVSVLLSRDAFLSRMATELLQSELSFKSDFQRFVEAALAHMNLVSKAYGSHGNQPTFKFWKALFGKVSDIMDKVSYLLPGSVFIEMISKLLQHDQVSMRKKAMDLLSSKLQHLDATKFEGDQLESLLTLVDMLLTIVQSPAAADESEADHAVMTQFALFCLKVLCKMIGQDNKERFEKIFPPVISLLSAPHTPPPVLGNALLCLSELVTSLKVKAIAKLYAFMPPLIELLGKRDLLQSNELFLVCGLTALQKILASLPHFLSPYILDILVQVGHVACLVQLDGDPSNKKSQPVIRLRAIRQHIVQDIPARVLVPAMNEAYSKLLQENQLGISCLLSILQMHTSHMPREDLSANQNALLTFYCKALDLRNDTSETVPYPRVQQIEGEAVDALVAMVIRLTELAFRPMFYRLHDWACSDDTQTHRNRKLTFFRLCDRMSEKLRSLFNMFVTHSLKVICTTLEVTNTGTSEDATGYYPNDTDLSRCVELVGYILSMLHNCLQYDTEGFVTTEIFNTLMQPLVNQLENFQSLEDIYSDHVTKSVVPAIGQLAVAAKDDIAWKSLNYAVCLKTKHSSSKVRFAALKALEEVAVKLGEEYMTLLPESIPFLAELMEDESEEVEQQCHHLVSKLEELLGESLKNYF